MKDKYAIACRWSARFGNPVRILIRKKQGKGCRAGKIILGCRGKSGINSNAII